MDKNNFVTIPSIVTDRVKSNRKDIINLFKNCPIPDDELLRNLGLFINPADLKKFLFINDLYQKIIDVHGIIIEFGVRWGQNLSLFQSLRSIYEPYNYNRKIVGFDTFKGFPTIHDKDGDSDFASVSAYSVTKNYEEYLDKVLRNLEQECPLNHIKKYELVKGDAVSEIDNYLKNNPETIISLAYFDFDIYEPTKKCLESIKNHLTKGSIIGFDELNHHHFPGETIALKEVFGLDKFGIKRSPFSHFQSFIVYE